MIVYIKTSDAPYVWKDINFLQTIYQVEVYDFIQKNSLCVFLINCLKLSWFLLKNKKKIKVITSIFVDYYSFIIIIYCFLFQKKSVFTLGGYECVSFPKIPYGAFSSPIKALFVGFALKNADVLLPVHETLVHNINYYYDVNGKPNGFLYHIKKTKAKIVTIHNAYQLSNCSPIKKNLNLVLCVGVCNTPETFYIKGIDNLLEASLRLHNFEFIIVGVHEKLLPWIRQNHPFQDNVKILGKINQEEVFELYNKARIYVQPSISEGMPNALCEAMLFQCYPIGSNITSIPDIIGETGTILQKRNPEEIVKAITNIDSSLNNEEAQARILRLFPLSRRHNQLKEVFDDLLK